MNDDEVKKRGAKRITARRFSGGGLRGKKSLWLLQRGNSGRVQIEVNSSADAGRRQGQDKENADDNTRGAGITGFDDRAKRNRNRPPVAPDQAQMVALPRSPAADPDEDLPDAAHPRIKRRKEAASM